MEKKIAAMLAEGFEEVEAIAVIDILRRARVQIDMIAVSKDIKVTSSHGIPIVADALIENTDFSQYDGIFLPGGLRGTNNLEACSELCSTILDFDREEKLLAAICAAPKIFGKLGVLKGRKAICYPGFENELTGAVVEAGAKAVKDGHIFTGRGMGTAIELGLKLVEEICGEEKARDLAAAIQYD